MIQNSLVRSSVARLCGCKKVFIRHLENFLGTVFRDGMSHQISSNKTSAVPNTSAFIQRWSNAVIAIAGLSVKCFSSDCWWKSSCCWVRPRREVCLFAINGLIITFDSPMKTQDSQRFINKVNHGKCGENAFGKSVKPHIKTKHFSSSNIYPFQRTSPVKSRYMETKNY